MATNYAQYQTVAAWLDANIGEHFRSAVISPAFAYKVNFNQGSDSVKLKVAGSLTATVATEATAHTNSTYTETSPATLQASRLKVYTEVSDEAVDLAGANLTALAVEAGKAIAEKVDTDTFALADTLNGGTVVGSTGVDATPSNLLEAAYRIRANDVTGQRVFILHPVQVYDVQSDILASAAPVFGNDVMLDLMNGQAPTANGYAGSFIGIPVFETTNLESLNTAADWGGMCITAGKTFAQGYFGGVKTEVAKNIEKSVYQISATLYFDTKEYRDESGVGIVTDQ